MLFTEVMLFIVRTVRNTYQRMQNLKFSNKKAGAVCSKRCCNMQRDCPQKEMNVLRIDGRKSKYAVEGCCVFSRNDREDKR
jgi:hypothetical protein